MNKLASTLVWAFVALLGAVAFGSLALGRGESVNSVWLVTAALCVYFIAYRFYSKFIADKVLKLDDSRPTPAIRHADGMDYVPTNRWVLYGHHFAAIAGAGPLVGPVLAAQMVICRGRSGSWRAWWWRERCRTSSCCSSRCDATASRSAR